LYRKNELREANTMLAMFGLGFFEILILASLGLFVLLGAVAVIVVITAVAGQPRDRS
jgi:hypothetical protein